MPRTCGCESDWQAVRDLPPASLSVVRQMEQGRYREESGPLEKVSGLRVPWSWRSTPRLLPQTARAWPLAVCLWSLSK